MFLLYILNITLTTSQDRVMLAIGEFHIVVGEKPIIPPIIGAVQKLLPQNPFNTIPTILWLPSLLLRLANNGGRPSKILVVGDRWWSSTEKVLATGSDELRYQPVSGFVMPAKGSN